LGPTTFVRAQEAGEAKLKRLADDSSTRAEAVEVTVAAGHGTTKTTLHPTPLIKYTDVPRRIEMATLWVWHDNGHPVALGKVEAYARKDGLEWLYCFTSASTGLVDGRWPDGHRFRASQPGIEWAVIDGPAPQPTAAGRLRQMKDLFQRFSATTKDDVLKTSDELRPLARPIHEYSSPRQGVIQGILCGFAANGTNPDVVVALEAVSGADGNAVPKQWRYGVIGMTAARISVRLGTAEVYTRPYVRSPGDHGTWTYFWEGAAQR
jgi:hypothetical protein